jgi:tetratricopeptide (TPR) repeat protein
MLNLRCIGAALVMLAAGGRAISGPGAADLNGIFRQACELYEKGDFGSALGQFQAVKAGGMENAALYYNIGNCYYREGQLGRAVASYRRALMLAPRDQDVKTNLALIRVAVGSGDSTLTAGRPAVTALPLRFFSPRQFQWIFYLAYYLAAACFLGVLFLRGRFRRVGVYGVIAAIVVAGCALGLAQYGISRFRAVTDGVVVADRTPLTSGPGDAFQEIATLPDGLELRLRAKSGIWVEVQLPTGEVGWLRDTTVEPI